MLFGQRGSIESSGNIIYSNSLKILGATQMGVLMYCARFKFCVTLNALQCPDGSEGCEGVLLEAGRRLSVCWRSIPARYGSCFESLRESSLLSEWTRMIVRSFG